MPLTYPLIRRPGGKMGTRTMARRRINLRSATKLKLERIARLQLLGKTTAEIAPTFQVSDAHLWFDAIFGSAFRRPHVGQIHCLTKEDV